MKLVSIILRRFFPLILLIIVLIGNSCLLSPNDRTNQLDVNIDDTIFVLSYEMFSPDNNPADPKVLLSWEPVKHELIAGYNIHRYDKDTFTETLYWYHYFYDPVVTDSIVDSELRYLPELRFIESTFLLVSTDAVNTVFLDTLFQLGDNLETDYTVEVFFEGTDFTYFSNHVVID